MSSEQKTNPPPWKNTINGRGPSPSGVYTRTGRSPAGPGIDRFSTDLTATGWSSAPRSVLSRSRTALMSCCHSGGVSIAFN